MNSKEAKKVRQLVRRDIRNLHKELIEAKPWYLPLFIWKRIIATLK